MQSSSLMLHTKPISVIRRFRIRSLKFPVRANVQLSFGVFQKMPDSREFVAGSPSCRKVCAPELRMVASFRFIHYGSGGGVQKQTALVTQCNAGPKQSIRMKVALRSGA